MTELEKVEKLREKANCSFAEAKEALDNSGGDILDALIYLERNGKATVPAGGGFFSGADAAVPTMQEPVGNDTGKSHSHGSGEEFSDMMKRFGAFLLKLFNMGLNNHLEATSRNGDKMFACPILIVILLAVFFPWITIPLFVISLFFGVRYRFSGKNLGKDSVNNVMDSASNVVDEVKKTFTESVAKSENKDKE